MKTDSIKHNAIEKALNILNIFSPRNHELSTNEISEILGYHRTTTIRTLLPLKTYGFLEQNKENKKYKLGASIAILSLSFHRSMENELVRFAKPYLKKLRDSVHEAVVLEVLAGRTTVRAHIIEGPGPLSFIAARQPGGKNWFTTPCPKILTGRSAPAVTVSSTGSRWITLQPPLSPNCELIHDRSLCPRMCESR